MIVCDFCKDFNKIAEEYEVILYKVKEAEVINRKKVHYCEDCILSETKSGIKND